MKQDRNQANVKAIKLHLYELSMQLRLALISFSNINEKCISFYHQTFKFAKCSSEHDQNQVFYVETIHRVLEEKKL